jgi:hypothetical protein
VWILVFAGVLRNRAMQTLYRGVTQSFFIIASKFSLAAKPNF